jgi:carboxypeptidase family protein
VAGSIERRQVSAAVGLVAITLFLPACGESRSPTQPPATPVAVSREFSVAGGVRDSAYRPLAGSKVEVVDGPRVGTAATTDQNGRFSFPGTFTGTVTLVASKDGYAPEMRRLPPRPPELLPPPQENERWESAFNLEPLGPSIDAAGEYALTLTADPACKLPDDARTRTYTARVNAIRRTYFQARLSDARFFSTVPCPPGQLPETCTYNLLAIGIADDYASIYAGLIEILNDAYLVVSAGTEGTFSSSGTARPVAGSFLYCPREPFLIDQGTWSCPTGAGGVECESANHQLTLVRR